LLDFPIGDPVCETVRGFSTEQKSLPQVQPPLPKPHLEGHTYAKTCSLITQSKTHPWEAFLGPDHNAISSETCLLKSWPPNGPQLIWEVKKGSGYSSPAISGDRLILFHRMGNLEIVKCLNPENGFLYWKFSYPTQYEDRYGYNNGPRSSPVIDGDRVYTVGAEGKLHCLHLMTGQVIWKRDLSAEFKLPQTFFGMGSTPLIEEKLLIVNVGAPGGPCVVAFDKIAGQQLWAAGDKWVPATPLQSGHGAWKTTGFCLCRRRKPSADWRPVGDRPKNRASRIRISLEKPELRVSECFISGCCSKPGIRFCQL